MTVALTATLRWRAANPADSARLAGLASLAGQPLLDPALGLLGRDVLDPGHDGPPVAEGVHDHPVAISRDEGGRLLDRGRAALDRALVGVVDIGAIDHGRVADV